MEAAGEFWNIDSLVLFPHTHGLGAVARSLTTNDSPGTERSLEIVNGRALAFRNEANKNKADSSNSNNEVVSDSFMTGSTTALNLLQSDSLMYNHRPLLFSGSSSLDASLGSLESGGLQFGKVTEVRRAVF